MQEPAIYSYALLDLSNYYVSAFTKTKPDPTHPTLNVPRCGISLTPRPRTLTCMTTHTCSRSKLPYVKLFSNVLVSGQQYVHRQEIIDTAVPVPQGSVPSPKSYKILHALFNIISLRMNEVYTSY